jgi:hypothetical protein
MTIVEGLWLPLPRLCVLRSKICLLKLSGQNWPVTGKSKSRPAPAHPASLLPPSINPHITPHPSTMDFGRPLISTAGIVSKSNIRLVPPTHLGNDPLDILVCQSSNDAARDLFLGNNNNHNNHNSNNSDDNDTLVNHSLYNEQHLPPPRPTISPGDLVVIFESFTNLNFVYATPKACFSNRNGHFPHDDFIGRPYGCKLRSSNNDGLGFLYLLRPTAELWGRSLPHRTQIVHELVRSIVFD